MRRLFTILLLSALSSQAATNKVTTVTPANVQAAQDAAAVNGDVIILAGNQTNSWTTNVWVYNGVTIICTDAPRSLTLLDDVVSSVGNNQCLFNFQTVSNRQYRLSGITFRNGTSRSVGGVGPNGVYSKGTISVYGTGNSNRIDNCIFDPLLNDQIFIQDFARGVSDHIQSDVGGNHHFITIQHKQWGGTSYDNGDGSWFLPSTLGGMDAWYIENCYITNSVSLGGSQLAWALDAFQGARFVGRYNTLSNCTWGTHGRESGARQRSPKQWEWYGNVVSASGPHVGAPRGGSGVIYSNVNYGPVQNAYLVDLYRGIHAFTPVWGEVNGLSMWDSNDPVVYVNAQHSGANGVQGAFTVAGSPWTVNAYVGMWVIDTNNIVNHNTQLTGGDYWTTNNFPIGPIYSNSVNTIYVYKDAFTPSGAGSCTISFTNGSYYQVRRVVAIDDVCGRGSGDLLSGSSPTPVYLNQPVDGVWVWSNKLNGAVANIAPRTAPFYVNGRDYTNGFPKPGYTALSYPHPLVGAPPPPNPPFIIQDVADQVVPINGTATFSLTVSSAISVSYQWFQFPSTLIAGATANTYTVSPVLRANDGQQYQVVATNNIGSVTSRWATLSLLPRAKIVGGSTLKGPSQL